MCIWRCCCHHLSSGLGSSSSQTWWRKDGWQYEAFESDSQKHSQLVGGFNPFEKSKWESSPNRGENKIFLKPPPSQQICWIPMSENSWMMLNDEVANYGCWKTSVTCQNIQTFCQIYHDSPTWKTVESVEDLPIQIAIYGFCGDRNSSPDPSELSLPDQALAQSSWPLPGACRRLLQHRKRDQRTKYLQGVEVVPPNT